MAPNALDTRFTDVTAIFFRQTGSPHTLGNRTVFSSNTWENIGGRTFSQRNPPAHPLRSQIPVLLYYAERPEVRLITLNTYDWTTVSKFSANAIIITESRRLTVTFRVHFFPLAYTRIWCRQILNGL